MKKYSCSNVYDKRWVQTHFELVPVYLSGSFPTFIQYLQNRFLKIISNYYNTMSILPDN